MHSCHSLILVALLAAVATKVDAGELQPVAGVDAAWPLAELFSTDTRFPRDVSRIAIEPDEIGRRYRLEFVADDGGRVNGLLAMPGDGYPTARLAVALHPMGADQTVWWREGEPLFGGEITGRLRQRGYAVLALDARWHGERKVDGIGPRDILAFAHGENPRPYHRVIVDSVRDYRLALDWADRQEDLDTGEPFVLGYSMGAQMSLLLAAMEPQVASVLAMVPPYVDRERSPVAPRNHVRAITEASVLLIAGREDPYSSRAQTRQVFDAIRSPDKNLVLLDSGHRLPESYLSVALSWIDERTGGDGR